MSHNIVVQGGKTVRLPTAGKYCDRDILVTAEGGGTALDVITASSLPDTVVDCQIVVITDTTPGTVYIDTDEPASLETGDVWVKLEAEGAVKLELSDESPYLRCGLTEAAQWDGSNWTDCVGHLGVAGAWVQFTRSMPPVGSPLNDFTWEEIGEISKSGLANEYFSVGDAKEIVLNGTVGETRFDNLSLWTFIIGIYHNPTYEGGAYIHFQFAKDKQTDGNNLCLVDEKYNTGVSTAGCFSMNTTASNSGAWASSPMRNNVLGNSYSPESPLPGSLMAALPTELLAVMKGATKYTDNTGGGKGNLEANVTATTDYLWLLSEYEVKGKKTTSNDYERNKQSQYAYYASGNPAEFKKHSDLSTSSIWWLRSVTASSSYKYCCVKADGSVTDGSANTSYGLAPCFCV